MTSADDTAWRYDNTAAVKSPSPGHLASLTSHPHPSNATEHHKQRRYTLTPDREVLGRVPYFCLFSVRICLPSTTMAAVVRSVGAAQPSTARRPAPRRSDVGPTPSRASRAKPALMECRAADIDKGCEVLCARKLPGSSRQVSGEASESSCAAIQLRAASLGLVAAAAVCTTALEAQAADSQSSAASVAEIAAASPRSATADALQHFLTGGVGGCVGAAAVFPIDLVKTRLQAQKGGKARYSSALDCFTSVVREEGVTGLYSGLSAQLIGVWPEKVFTRSTSLDSCFAASLRAVYPGKTVAFPCVPAAAYSCACKTESQSLTFMGFPI